ncbi:unnamed protein product [Schistosoma margrebowiei]|uniref:Cathepsin propeptide inhibitor domain-containing protein n=1 Tax=Schistosoma margrebowiei TaxID=48269 RepID=A0AA85AJR4_9TREM|nr:unnamed protein product [Schistosoma margrebowiei]
MMNTMIVEFVCIFICLIAINVNAVPTTKPHPVTVKQSTPVHHEEESFFKRTWHKFTSMFGSSDSDSKPNENLSLKERIINKFNSIFGEEEYNPSKDSDFVDRLWMLFKHCFLNFKNLAKIFSI